MAKTARVIAVLIFGLLGLLAGLASSPPQDIRVGNLTPNSLAISWLTKRPTLGCITNFFKCDDHGRRLRTHHVTLSGLKPEKAYTLWVQNGLFFTPIKVATEKATENAPSVPHPAYGQVTYADKITLAKFVNVLVTVGDRLLSTYTNAEGGWSLDVGDTKDQKAFLLQVEAGNGLSAKKLFYLGEHQPVGVVILE